MRKIEKVWKKNEHTHLHVGSDCRACVRQCITRKHFRFRSLFSLSLFFPLALFCLWNCSWLSECLFSLPFVIELRLTLLRVTPSCPFRINFVHLIFCVLLLFILYLASCLLNYPLYRKKSGRLLQTPPSRCFTSASWTWWLALCIAPRATSSSASAASWNPSSRTTKSWAPTPGEWVGVLC